MINICKKFPQISMMHRLKHPNIIKLFGYGSTPKGDHFIVMELMDGGSIDGGYACI